MSEITFGGGDDDGGGGGGSGFDLNEILDQLEEAQERIVENPKLAQMMGVDVEMIGDISEHTTEGEDGNTNIDVSAGFIADMIGGLEDQGMGDMTLSEFREYVEENSGMVDKMIQSQLEG